MQRLVSRMKIERKFGVGTKHIVLIGNQESSLKYPYLFIKILEPQKRGRGPAHRCVY